MPEWHINGDTATLDEPSLTEQLAGEQQTNSFLQERLADLEHLYMEDLGWRKIGAEGDAQFRPEARKQIAAYSRIMAAANPLINRGINLRIGYIWGQGVNVAIADDGATGQDVNAVWQEFWEDPLNTNTFCAPEAQTALERQLHTDGEVALALPTDPITGRVRVRNIPPEEIDDIIADPEDAANVWLYQRRWTVRTRQQDGTDKVEDRVTYYPRLGWRPAIRPRTWGGKEIRWDAPIRFVSVNKLRPNDQRGLGDVFPALPWAKLDKEFLENWAVYMKSMTRILYQVTAKGSKTQQAAAAVVAAAAAPGNPGGAGSTAAMDPNTAMSVVSKSGAQIDAESHKPLASYVAAALGVPLTMLLGDPGSTGARAVAETLDEPLQLEMGLRQKLWTGVLQDIADYVIDSAVLAPVNGLRGTNRRDGDRLVVDLPEGDQRTVEVTWPDYDSTPIDVLMKAISLADSTDTVPPVEILKLILKAFQIDDVDEIIDLVTDDNGDWIPTETRNAATAARQQDRGEA